MTGKHKYLLPPKNLDWDWLVGPTFQEYKNCGEYSKRVIKHANGLVIILEFGYSDDPKSRIIRKILNITLDYSFALDGHDGSYKSYSYIVKEIDNSHLENIKRLSLNEDIKYRLKKIADLINEGKKLTRPQLTLWETASFLGINVFQQEII